MPINYSGLRSRAFSGGPARPLRHQIAGQREGDTILDAMETDRLSGEREGYQQNLGAMAALEKMYGSPSLVRSEGNNFATSSGTQTRAGRAFAMDAPRRQAAQGEEIEGNIREFMGTEYPAGVRKSEIAAGAERYKADQDASSRRFAATEAGRARLGSTVMGLSPTRKTGNWFGPSEEEDPMVGPAQRALLQGMTGGSGGGAPRGMGGIDPESVRSAAERAIGRPLDDGELDEILNDPESLRELGIR